MNPADLGEAGPARPGGLEPPPNPFATRFIDPQVLEYQFIEGLSAEQLIEQLESAGWHGQVVGPHGSGKSTLLESLIRLAEHRGRQVYRYRLHDRQRSLPAAAADHGVWNPSSLVVVDGYEQLSWLWRWRLHAWCRRAGSGLLITTHQPRREPTLYRTSTSEQLLQCLVAKLTTGLPYTDQPSTDQVRQAFIRSGGNLREALLLLYDVVEHQRRHASLEN
jgi:hypothetical protein